jgi:hypothetical protein
MFVTDFQNLKQIVQAHLPFVIEEWNDECKSRME